MPKLSAAALKAKIATLQKQLQAAEKNKAPAIKKVVALMKKLGVTVADLQGTAPAAAKGRRGRPAGTGEKTKGKAKTKRAEDVAAQLELLLASMHDLPEPKAQQDGGRKLRVTRKRPPYDAPADPLEAAQ